MTETKPNPFLSERWQKAWAATPQSKHPEAVPDGTPYDLPALMDPPNWRSETWLWERWLEGSCRYFVQKYPDSVMAKTMLRQAEAALEYRKTVPADQVYWRPDTRTEAQKAA